MRETELKFAVHPSFVVPDVVGVAGVAKAERLPAQELIAAYYDVADLRLARSGVTLRYRTGEESGPMWTLKLPADADPNTREELSFQGDQHQIPEEAIDLITAYRRSGELELVATLLTSRVPWRLTGVDGSLLATLADDEVSLVDGEDLRARFREVEIESDGLSLKKLALLGEVLKSAGAMPSEPIPKAVRALGPRATAPPDVAIGVDPGPKDPAGDAVQAAIARATTRLIANDPAARLGNIEGVHQTRVAARRLRSDIRMFAALLDRDWVHGTSQELRWLADKLGAVRDLNVLQLNLSKDVHDLGDELEPLLHILEARETAAREQLQGALRSDRYSSLIDRLISAAASPPLAKAAAQPCGEILPKLVRPVYLDLRNEAKKAGPSYSSESWHRVRIRAKRARYATEAVAPSLGSDEGAARRLASAAARVQDVLGTHQDAVVAAALIEGVVAEHQASPRFALSAGRVIERQHARAQRALTEWKPAWADLDRKKNTLWLNG